MNKIEGQNSGFNGSSRFSNRVGAAALAFTLAVGGSGIGNINEVRAEAESSVVVNETERETPTQRIIDNRERIADLLKGDYFEKNRKLSEYKDMLKDRECQDINLDFCAGILYSIDTADGFNDAVFDKWESTTILRDFVTKEQVFKFGKTGEGLDVVYFLNEKGEKTKEPAILYVATPEVKKQKIDVVEKGIAYWEKYDQDFREVLVDNEVRIILHSQASSNKKISVFKYETGIFYYNTSDSNPNYFSDSIAFGITMEMFGTKGDALGGKFNKYAVGVIKERLALDCGRYLAEKTKDKNMNGYVQARQETVDLYTQKYWIDKRQQMWYLEHLIKIIKENNLITPFGAETWEEIDSIKE